MVRYAGVEVPRLLLKELGVTYSIGRECAGPLFLLKNYGRKTTEIRGIYPSSCKYSALIFYISPTGKVMHNPKGWPVAPITGGGNTSDLAAEAAHLYEQALSRAIAESVEVKRQRIVRYKIYRSVKADIPVHFEDWEPPSGFYTVPDEEVKPEWI